VVTTRGRVDQDDLGEYNKCDARRELSGVVRMLAREAGRSIVGTARKTSCPAIVCVLRDSEYQFNRDIKSPK